MLLSLNNQDPLDLAACIKQERVMVKDLKVGDIIVDDHTVWHIATIVKDENGTFQIRDEDRNGSIGDLAENIYSIISRECIK